MWGVIIELSCGGRRSGDVLADPVDGDRCFDVRVQTFVHGAGVGRVLEELFLFRRVAAMNGQGHGQATDATRRRIHMLFYGCLAALEVEVVATSNDAQSCQDAGC